MNFENLDEFFSLICENILHIDPSKKILFAQCKIASRSRGLYRGVDPGGAGGATAPPMKMLGANISFCPPPPIIPANP